MSKQAITITFGRQQRIDALCWRLGKGLLAFLGALSLLVAAGSFQITFAEERSATVNGDVAAGKTSTTRLRNLPKGASLKVDLTTSGEVVIWLLNDDDYRRFPSAKRPLFESRTDNKLAISLLIPETGNYYVVIDNRSGRAAREFTLSVNAAAGVAPAGRPDRTQAQFDRLEQQLRRFLIFSELELSAASCGTANAFSSGNSILICTEFARKLIDELEDRGKAGDVLLFAILHEVGHVLLQQWDYPFFDNEDLADEFATVLMVIFDSGKQARSQAQYFAAVPTGVEAERRRGSDGRHSLSVQRARNILRWLNDPDLVSRWQSVLVPRIQTAVLERLKRQPTPWTDTALVEAELAARGKAE